MGKKTPNSQSKHTKQNPSRLQNGDSKENSQLVRLITLVVLIVAVVLYFSFFTTDNEPTIAIRQPANNGGNTINPPCSRGRGHMSPIEDTKGLLRHYESIPNTDEFYLNHIRKSRPALIHNTMNSWKALKRWKSDEYLKEKVGGKYVLVERSNDNRFGHLMLQNKSWEWWNMTIAEFLSKYEEEEDHWYLDYALPKELSSDIKLPSWIPCLETGVQKNDPFWAYINMWMGGGEENSLLHNDLEDNLLHMVQGYKRVTLIPPDTPSEYIYEIYNDNSTETKLSYVDNYDPNRYEKYPLYKKVQPIHIVVGPGDVLFIPALWWHQVRSYCRSISLTIWFDTHLVKSMGEEFVWTHKTEEIYKILQTHKPACSW